MDPQPAASLARSDFDALIFDLDGVVTDTARLHAAAWQHTFDELLRRRAEADQVPFRPFDPDADYRRYVDGRPRYEGVRSFLASRSLVLPEGRAEDGPERDTVQGVGNRKRDRFLRLLDERGPPVLGDSLRMLRLVRRLGYRTAMVSASRNAGLILQRTGLEGLFDLQVDGQLAEAEGLAGKPAPDSFLYAARRLGVAPGRAAVIEDALAGVQAAHAGGFGRVIALVRRGDEEAYRQAGADLVLADLAELPLAERGDDQPAATLPSALAQQPPAAPLVLLDYDGTLTPIVERPEQAVLAPATRQVLVDLAAACPVAVVSGRDLTVLRELVDLPGLWYAGSHGFDILGPQGERYAPAALDDYRPELERLGAELEQGVGQVPGVLLERKRYSIAVHTRLVAEDRRPPVEAQLQALRRRYPKLKTTLGKRVVEFQPAIDWHKGRAVEYLLQTLDPRAERCPIYVGDDITDEDAFRVLRGIGLGILVREVDRPTAARLALDDTEAVRAYLQRLMGTS